MLRVLFCQFDVWVFSSSLLDADDWTEHKDSIVAYIVSVSGHWLFSMTASTGPNLQTGAPGIPGGEQLHKTARSAYTRFYKNMPRKEAATYRAQALKLLGRCIKTQLGDSVLKPDHWLVNEGKDKVGATSGVLLASTSTPVAAVTTAAAAAAAATGP